MSLILNELEKVAVSKVLLDIINADGKIDINEVLYMNQLKKLLNITDEQIQQAKKMNAFLCLAIIKEMAHSEKQLLAHMMFEMINADGDDNLEEKKVFEVVCNFAEISIN